MILKIGDVLSEEGDSDVLSESMLLVSESYIRYKCRNSEISLGLCCVRAELDYHRFDLLYLWY